MSLSGNFVRCYVFDVSKDLFECEFVKVLIVLRRLNPSLPRFKLVNV